MAIVFRCPECDHKLRASASAAGRKSKCKCGATVVIPGSSVESGTGADMIAADDDDAFRSAWQLKPKFNAASGDLCEAITAWSPLCAQQKSSQPLPKKNTSPAYWQGILVGAAGVLAVSLLVIGLMYAFRSPSPNAAEEQQSAQGDDKPNPPETPGGKKDGAAPSSTADEPSGGQPEDKDKENPSEVPNPAAPPPSPANSSSATVANPPAKDPLKPPAVKEPPKPAPIILDGIEIVEWYTLAKAVALDGKEEFDLVPNDAAAKAGLVLVAVKTRIPAEFLADRKFDPEKMVRDVMLKIPSSNDPYSAEGWAINDKHWFAPEKGQYPFPPAKAGVISATWLFTAPLRELQTGRTTFIIRDHPPVFLNLACRRGS